MAVYNSPDGYQPNTQGIFAALGFFDGVHLGHRAVIGACTAESAGLPCAVLTFRENPAAALGRPCPPVLTDNARKAALMESIGADDIIFSDFETIRDYSAEEFVRLILHEKLNVRRVYCGFNYRFGRMGEGDTAALTQLCARYGIGVRVIAPIEIDGVQVSSTRIRELIASGEIGRANAMLGYRYRFEGEIGSGNHIGRAMGFPTVNLAIPTGAAVPRYGVYASDILLDGVVYRGATNIGVHPTVGVNPTPLCETFLTDFKGGDLYGKHAACELREFIRPEKRFGSIEELTAQVKADCKRISELSADAVDIRA